MPSTLSNVIFLWSCRSWFPNQGLNPYPLYWKLRVLNTGPPGKSQVMPTFNLYQFDRKKWHLSFAFICILSLVRLASLNKIIHFFSGGCLLNYQNYILNLFFFWVGYTVFLICTNCIGYVNTMSYLLQIFLLICVCLF